MTSLAELRALADMREALARLISQPYYPSALLAMRALDALEAEHAALLEVAQAAQALAAVEEFEPPSWLAARWNRLRVALAALAADQEPT